MNKREKIELQVGRMRADVSDIGRTLNELLVHVTRLQICVSVMEDTLSKPKAATAVQDTEDRSGPYVNPID